MFSSNTAKTTIATVVMMIVALGSALYMWNFIDTLGSELEISMQSIRDQAVLEREYSNLQMELDETADDHERLSGFVLKGETGTIALLSQIDEIAKQLGIAVETKTLDVMVTPEPGFDTLVAEFAVSGPERSVMKMLELFELLPYKSEVVSLTAARAVDKGTGLSTMQQSVVLNVSLLEE